MTHTSERNRDDDLRAAISDLAARMQRVEERLGFQTTPARRASEIPTRPPPEADKAGSDNRDALEFALGQNWFALIGVLVLAMGMAFLLCLPFAEWPAALPSCAGYVICGAIFVLAHLSRRSFETISSYLRGAGMLLLFFATLRFFYFGETQALETSSLAGRALLILVLAINLGVAWRWTSFPLFLIALATGYATAVAVDSTGFILGLITVLSGIAVFAQLKHDWRTLAPIAFLLSVATYAIWAVGNPVVGHEIAWQRNAPLAVYVVPLWVAVYSLSLAFRRDLQREDSIVEATGILICGLGLAAFLVYSLLTDGSTFIAAHLLAATVWLVLAVIFWVREESFFSTFIYAMTGYLALSFALLKAFEVPEVFVALSLQSLVVIGTAIYFRSPFIIVTNCLIFWGTILGYIVVAEAEYGMSIGFGIVALISARLLNWQKDRLSLKTDLVRNLYLLIAFLVFPYALYYLVPESLLAVSWVGIALFYYGMSVIVKNPKYRWMGHMTLMLTALYAIVLGTSRLDSQLRIITFFILGTIMVIVSLAFTKMRKKSEETKPPQEEPSPPA